MRGEVRRLRAARRAQAWRGAWAWASREYASFPGSNPCERYLSVDGCSDELPPKGVKRALSTLPGRAAGRGADRARLPAPGQAPGRSRAIFPHAPKQPPLSTRLTRLPANISLGLPGSSPSAAYTSRRPSAPTAAAPTHDSDVPDPAQWPRLRQSATATVLVNDAATPPYPEHLTFCHQLPNIYRSRASGRGAEMPASDRSRTGCYTCR